VEGKIETIDHRLVNIQFSFFCFFNVYMHLRESKTRETFANREC